MVIKYWSRLLFKTQGSGSRFLGQDSSYLDQDSYNLAHDSCNFFNNRILGFHLFEKTSILMAIHLNNYFLWFSHHTFLNRSVIEKILVKILVTLESCIMTKIHQILFKNDKILTKIHKIFSLGISPMMAPVPMS